MCVGRLVFSMGGCGKKVGRLVAHSSVDQPPEGPVPARFSSIISRARATFDASLHTRVHHGPADGVTTTIGAARAGRLTAPCVPRPARYEPTVVDTMVNDVRVIYKRNVVLSLRFHLEVKEMFQ